MSRDSGTEDDIYEESMMSHHDYDSTSIEDMTEHNTDNVSTCFEDPEHYTYDDSTCMEDMELYVDNGSSCMEPMEHYTDNGSTCLGDMEYYTNNYSPSMDDFECDIDDASPSMDDMENFNDFDGSSISHEEFLHRVEMEAYYAKQEEAHHQDSMTFKAKRATPKGTTYFDDSPPRRHVPPPRWRQAPPSPRHQAPSPPRRQALPSPRRQASSPPRRQAPTPIQPRVASKHHMHQEAPRNKALHRQTSSHEHRHHKEDTRHRQRHLRHKDEEFKMSTNHNAQASSRRHHKHKKSAKANDHRRECHMDDQVRHLHQPSARHANDLRRHHHRAPSTTRATTTMAPRASLPPHHQASTPTLDFRDLANEENEDLYFAKLVEFGKRMSTLQDGGSQGHICDEVDPRTSLDNTMSLLPPLLRDGHKTVEHWIFHSTMEASDDAHHMSSNLGGDKVKNGDHGIFPSPKEAHGVEETEPIPICLSDDVVPIPSEYEIHLAHLSENKSEMSDSPYVRLSASTWRARAILLVS